MQAGDSFRDALRNVSVIYCDWQMSWAASSQVALCSQFSTPKETFHNHCLSSLSVTRANTLWLKQPTQFLQVRAFPAGIKKGRVLKKQPHCAQQLDDVEHAYQLEAPELGTLCNKIFGLNGVHYRGVPLYYPQCIMCVEEMLFCETTASLPCK